MPGVLGHNGSHDDLYAYCGEKVLLRGVNQMSVWTDATGSSYPAIASFGTNVIRIVYETAGSPSGLDSLVTKAEENKMIPMPELHDATGDFSKVGTWSIGGRRHRSSR